jgi:hypothetical protein
MSVGGGPPPRPEPEPLRARMREALGEHADPRTDGLVRRAEIVVAAETSAWEGSAGRVQAHRVGLGLDAADLGAISGAPHLENALVEAAAAGIAALEPEGARWTLRHLQLFWLPRRASRAGYRDAPPPPPSLLDAVAAFLIARGEAGAAEHAAGLEVHVGGGDDAVVVRGAGRAHRAPIQACLQSLLCGFEGRPVHVAWAGP